MKYIFALIGGGVGLFLSAYILAVILKVDSQQGEPIAIFIGIISIVFTYKYFNDNKSIKETIADGVSYVKTTTEDISSLVDNKDAEFYAIAEQEIKDDVINNGLWSQALVKAKGDENLRKIEYMKLRVKQLKKGKINE